MKKQYELIKDGWVKGTFEKTREGLEQAYDEAYQILMDYEEVDLVEHPYASEINELEIQLSTYNACGEHVECELVHEFAPEEIQKDNWEGAVDGR